MNDQTNPIRDWNWADRPCPHESACREPARSHYHLVTRPGGPVIVVHQDETPDQAEEAFIVRAYVQRGVMSGAEMVRVAGWGA